MSFKYDENSTKDRKCTEVFNFPPQSILFQNIDTEFYAGREKIEKTV